MAGMCRVPGAGRNVFGGHLVDAPVAEDVPDHGRADIVRHRGEEAGFCP